MLLPGDGLKKQLRQYQSQWLADSSLVTRTSQWKSYFTFCREFGYETTLPATLEMVLLYVVHLANRLVYKSIQAYLGAVWILHDMASVPHIDRDTFELIVTMRGIKRVLGDVTVQARPATLRDLSQIFGALDLTDGRDVAFWVAILLGFRGLLRKSNVLEVGLAVLVSDIRWEPWGMTVVVRRTKTISYKERVLEIPFVPVRGSMFCVYTFVQLLFSMLDYPGSDSQLVGYMGRGGYTRCSYGWYCKKLSNLCTVLKLEKMSSHSMRRGGASLLAEAGVSLIDIKNLGDWKSMSVLYYLSRTMDSKVILERRIVQDIYVNPGPYMHD